MSELSWSAQQYTQFERERTRPVHDLLSAVPALGVRHAIDLGCGPGNSTEALAQRFPGAEIIGLDSSADMLAAAQRRLPQVRFEAQDLRDWVALAPPRAPVDFILSNAVLQWVPAHATLLPALLARLEPRGVLAVQVPDNLEEPAQQLMREVAAAGPWAVRLAHADATRVRIEPPDWYHRLLSDAGAHTEVWRTTYYHALVGEPGVIDWFQGTGLRPFLEPLTQAERGEFLARYAAGVRRAHPPRPDGTVLLPMPRLFIVAQRAR